MMTAAIIVTIVLLPLSLLIALGRGDFLIAGYNTADVRERARCNVKRLRGVVAVLMFVIVLAFWLSDLLCMGAKSVFFLVISAVLIAVVLANTWAKRG